jgi:hypothetical protein
MNRNCKQRNNRIRWSSDQLENKVDEAYQIVMNKIDRDPFEHGGPEGRIEW